MPSTSKHTKFFLAILLAAIVLRAVILFAGQRYLRSDEAVVGLMAMHIVTQGERPLYLYGQNYGGGHAIVAYIAAPIFALLGRPSATALTATSILFSVANILLVWLIVRRYLGEFAAVLAAGLYAFSPPIVYQSALVNGGSETLFLALLALWFFLRNYVDRQAPQLNAFLVGLFSALAYWSMDYALLYPLVFVLLWAVDWKRSGWRWVLPFAAGAMLGALPILYYLIQADSWGIGKMMFSTRSSQGLVAHVLGAWKGIFTGDLAAYFGGEIDDFKPVGFGAWIHAVAALAAIVFLIWRYGPAAYRRLTGVEKASVPAIAPVVMPAVFVLLYLCIYSVVKYSLPEWRTPRYFLPLCPFVSIAIAVVAVDIKAWKRWAGLALVVFLMAHGAFLALKIGLRPWHEEHRIRTSGAEITALADSLRARGVRIAFAPYEIQWRLMFEMDESVIVSCVDISPLPRYAPYEDAVFRRALQGEPFAFIFRKDFAFAEKSSRDAGTPFTRAFFQEVCRRAGIPPEGIPAGSEFVLYYPLDGRFAVTLNVMLAQRMQMQVPRQR